VELRGHEVRRSTEKILVTHGGNLPRPGDLDELLEDPRANAAALAERLPSAVAEVIDRQIECLVDVVDDGEYVKAGDYGGYIHSRVTGWEMLPVDPSKPRKRAGVAERDRKDFPGFYASGLWLQGSGGPVRPGFFKPGVVPQEPVQERVCTGPISYVGQDAIARDVGALRAGIVGKDVEGFIACLGPLSLGAGARNEFYATEQEYMTVVAETVREEYRAVADAGFVVQIDEPEFATSWMFYPDWTIEQYRDYLRFCVEIINHALEGVPQDQVRFHVCWGSGHRPHTNDVPLRDIADLLLRINADAYSVEAGNVRHEHEWHVWEDVNLPEGKTLIPGVVSHATDLVEHPELIAERLCNYASVVGREGVQAGTDCGIGSRVGHEEVAWAKLRAMGEGAALASSRLWH
jgi:5-methyltetrahydropteroyltriglutamate--homocysteine methyltransferase